MSSAAACNETNVLPHAKNTVVVIHACIKNSILGLTATLLGEAQQRNTSHSHSLAEIRCTPTICSTEEEEITTCISCCRWLRVDALQQCAPHCSTKAAAMQLSVHLSDRLSILGSSLSRTTAGHSIISPTSTTRTAKGLCFWFPGNLEKHQSTPAKGKRTERRRLTPHHPSSRSKSTRRMFPRSLPEHPDTNKRSFLQSPLSRSYQYAADHRLTRQSFPHFPLWSQSISYPFHMKLET